jgi:iron transport multicopper oxidase
MKISSLTLLLLSPVLVLADSSYDWNIGYINDVTLGSQSRRAIGVNNVWPPPVLHVNEGENLIVRVKNNLDVPTALHSHGLFQNGSQYYDGAAGITQCPIPAV